MDKLQNKKGFVFNGGGVLGIGHIGGLAKLRDIGFDFSSVKYFAGTSVGAMVAAMLACGGTVDFMTDQILNLDFTQFEDGCINPYRILTRYGWRKGAFLQSFVRDTIGKLTGRPDITFLELYQLNGNYLVVPATKNYKECVYFDYFRTPNLPVWEGVARSANIPGLYPAIVDEDGDMYTDGGALDNFPLWYLKKFLPAEQILGFRLMSRTELRDLKGDNLHSDPPGNLCEAIVALTSAIYNQALRLHEKDEDWKEIIKIDVGSMSSINFRLDMSKKQWLFNQGEFGVAEYLNGINNIVDNQGSECSDSRSDSELLFVRSGKEDL